MPSSPIGLQRAAPPSTDLISPRVVPANHHALDARGLADAFLFSASLVRSQNGRNILQPEPALQHLSVLL